MKLYTSKLSGHSHRARLFLSLVGTDCEIVEIDLAKGEHRTTEFLRLNPMGQVPVLLDGEVAIPDSNAILVYLAKKLRRQDWLPEAPTDAARVQRWLSIAAGPIAFGPAAARLVTLFHASFDSAEVIRRANMILGQLDTELTSRAWLAADHPTIADVAVYSYVALAPEGNVDLRPFDAVRGWLARIENLPGFVAMTRSPVGLNAPA